MVHRDDGGVVTRVSRIPPDRTHLTVQGLEIPRSTSLNDIKFVVLAILWLRNCEIFGGTSTLFHKSSM